MSKYPKPFVIAEIGCNHKGDMELAKELVKVAKNLLQCGCGEISEEK